MTIELSLRRRSTHAKVVAVIWLIFAATLLVGTYASLPFVAGKTLLSVSQFESGEKAHDTSSSAPSSSALSKLDNPIRVFALTILVLGVAAVSFASYLLGKAGFIELERSGRLSGIADALCLAGSDLNQLEKAAGLLVPKSKFVSGTNPISQEDLKTLLEVLKRLK